jgi:hypothetical protein
VTMPGFADELSDRQAATLASYLTRRYGHPAAEVTEEQVKQLRGGGAGPGLVLAVQATISLVAMLAVAAVGAWLWRITGSKRRS